MSHHRWHFHTLCLAVFALLAFVGTYPLALHATTAVPASGDTWMYYWNLWWVKRALVVLHTNPYITSEVYFPYGATLYFHSLNLLPSLLAIPVVEWFGLAAGYNAVVLLSCVLTGYGTYRLLLYILRDEPTETDAALRAGAVVGGVVFTFSSYRAVHLLGHLDLVSTEWLPLFVLFALKSIREPQWRNPVFAAMFFVAAALTTWYYALFLALFTAFLVTWTSATHKWTLLGAGRAAVGVSISAALLWPILVPMIHAGASTGRTANPGYDIDRFSGDLLAFVLPPPWSVVTTGSAYRLIERHAPGLEAVMSLGLVPLALAALGVSRRRIHRFWLAAGIFFAALALGPVPHVAGRPFPGLSWVAPYYWLERLPFGDVPRVPSRFVVMTMLSVAVLAGAGAVMLFDRFGRRSGIAMSTLAATAIVLEGTMLPLPLSGVEVPSYFTRLARAQVHGGVLEVPIPADPSRYPVRMLFQTVHQQPIYGGYLARGLPPLAFDALPGFAPFTGPGVLDDVVIYDRHELPAIGRTVLQTYGVRRLVLERTLMTSTAFAAARGRADALLGTDARDYEDPEVMAYTVRKDGESLSELSRPTVWLDTGWSYLERLPAGRSDLDGRSPRWRWMGNRARLGLAAPASTTVRLDLRARAFGKPRRLRLMLGGTQVATLTVAVGGGEFRTTPVHLAKGVSFIDLVSLDGADSPTADPRRLSVALFRVQIEQP